LLSDLDIKRKSVLALYFKNKKVKRLASVGQVSLSWINPLPPSDAVRQQKNLLWRIFSV